MSKLYHSSQKGHIHLVIILGILVLCGVGYTGYRVYEDNSKSPTPSISNNTVAASNSTGSATAPTTTTNTYSASKQEIVTPLASGTSNTALNSDLSAVNSSINQESQSANYSNTALNDSQQQITVPTN